MAALTYEGLGDFLLAALVRQQPAALAPFFSTTTADAYFQTEFPEAIRYAEGRIYKELVLLATRNTDSSLVTTANSRTIAIGGLPSPFVVVEGLALITPATVSNPAVGTRVPYDVGSLDLIDQIWPQEAVVAAPSVIDYNTRIWAMRDNQTIVICPTPDAAYTVLLTGLFQPIPISSANPVTYLSTVYPELLEAACMVYMTGALLKNFGAKADNPQMAVSWESETTRLIALAEKEEMRRRGLMPDVATPGKAQ